jgi:ATP adenylyltransferase
MTFDELVVFLERRMRMSHIYQPFLIQMLIDADGSATVRQIAAGLDVEDNRQRRYYEDRIRKMPVPVLLSHGVIDSVPIVL